MTSGGAHIVLVEDNEATRYAVTRVLRNAGYRVTPAGDGETGLQLARSAQPDLVLLDVKLPDLSGFDVVRRLKQDPVTSGIPVVHLSATSISTAERVRGLEGGADAYLTHPVEPRVLVATLDALLRARRAESRYRRVFQTGLLGIVTWDRAGVVVDANETFLRLVGYTREDVTSGSLSWASIAPPADSGAARLPLTAPDGAVDVDLVHRDGHRLPVLFGRAADEGAEDAVAFVLDNSERKRAEEALREADRRKDEFLAVLSHELRNPLAPIRNSIRILERVPPGSAQATRSLGVIDRQTRHLARLVDDLMDVTRISRGKIELQRQRADVRDVVRKTSDDVRSIFENEGVSLAVDLPSEPVWADVDATRIAQVVANLLHNAVKFTPRGGSVTAAVEAVGALAYVRVQDDGVGIDPADLERMFQPFAQADRSLARAQGGLGLGLALVLGIVELHGGTVSARSEGAGRGAVFTVTLPLSPPPQAEAQPGDAPPASRPRRVLIIEDNVDAGQSLAEVLGLFGHEVRVALDGRSGIAAARESPPDVVLCDVGLPDMDGYQVGRAMREEEALRGTRLVALSGYAQPEDRERARRAGFDAHIAKPPSLDALQQILRDCVPGA